MAKRRQQAALAAALKYGPQEDAVRQLILGLQSDYRLGVKQEKGIGRVLRNSAKAAIPGIQKSYADARSTSDMVRAALTGDLGKLGSAAAPWQGSAAVEKAGAASRLAESEAAATSELNSRVSDAASGQAYAIRNLGDRYLADRNKAFGSLASIAGQRGAFAALTEGQLARQDKQIATTRRGQTLAHLDRVAAEQGRSARSAASIAAKGGKKGKPAFTQTQIRAGKAKYRSAVATAQQFRSSPKWAEARKKLKGDESHRLAQAISGIVKDPLMAFAGAQAALYGGRVGPHTAHLFHHEFGFHLRRFTLQQRVGGAVSTGGLGPLGG